MSNKNFENIIEELKDRNITVEVKLCPICENEISVNNNRYTCPKCGYVDSYLSRIITNNVIKLKKFEFIAVVAHNPIDLNKYGEMGYEICGIVTTKLRDCAEKYQTLIWMQKEIIN